MINENGHILSSTKPLKVLQYSITQTKGTKMIDKIWQYLNNTENPDYDGLVQIQQWIVHQTKATSCSEQAHDLLELDEAIDEIIYTLEAK